MRGMVGSLPPSTSPPHRWDMEAETFEKYFLGSLWSSAQASIAEEEYTDAVQDLVRVYEFYRQQNRTKQMKHTSTIIMNCVTKQSESGKPSPEMERLLQTIPNVFS